QRPRQPLRLQHAGRHHRALPWIGPREARLPPRHRAARGDRGVARRSTMAANPLYHDIILEHYEYPRNKGEIERADATSRGANAMCGDDLVVSVRLDEPGAAVEDVAWNGHACAIGEASASMMTEAIKGGQNADARRWVQTVRGVITNKPEE